ncbi:MAG: ribosome-associated translation inhibitor RaiA [Candidatus Omnitrophota bacterium]
MQIVITGRHFDVTGPIKDFVEEKISHLEPLAYNVLKAHVILSVEKFRHLAEVTIWTKHHNITAKTQTHDVYASVDAAITKVRNQLVRYHDKMKERKRETQKKIGKR